MNIILAAFLIVIAYSIGRWIGRTNLDQFLDMTPNGQLDWLLKDVMAREGLTGISNPYNPEKGAFLLKEFAKHLANKTTEDELAQKMNIGLRSVQELKIVVSNFIYPDPNLWRKGWDK